MLGMFVKKLYVKQKYNKVFFYGTTSNNTINLLNIFFRSI